MGTPSLEALPATEDEAELPWTQSVVLAGKGVAIPSSGESPEPFSFSVGLGSAAGYSARAWLSISVQQAGVVKN